MLDPSAAARPRKPWLAYLLSLCLPGLGQLYTGHWKRGIAVCLGGVVLLMALAFAGLPRTFAGFLVWLCLGLVYCDWTMRDASRLAVNKHDYRLKPFNRWYLYGLLAILPGFAADPLIALLPIQAFETQTGDHILADVIWWHHHVPSRGDLVIFPSPEAPASFSVERVVAVAGDRLEMRGKAVLINGRALGHPLRDSFRSLVVPAGTVFVLDDNRVDSRLDGPIPISRLRARPLFLYWAADKSRIGTSLR